MVECKPLVNGCPWNWLVCAHAAAGGHFKVLKWARAHHCDWDESTCAAAAQSGHLEVLQWARAHGCPWDWRTRALAGSNEVRQWAIDHGCPAQPTLHTAQVAIHDAIAGLNIGAELQAGDDTRPLISST